MVIEKLKIGSARRKGDEYQDLNALRLALEQYIQRKDCQIYIDYENIGILDDIIIESNDTVEAYQIKYSINPHGVYTLTDFIDPKDPNSNLSTKKFESLPLRQIRRRRIDPERVLIMRRTEAL